ncbi:MAG: glycoside hydrolase domain-containing protein [Rhodospirillales bacterium]
MAARRSLNTAAAVFVFLCAASATGATSAQGATADESSPALLHPVERPAYARAGDWRTEATRTGRPGETVMAVIRTGGAPCAPVTATGADVAFSQMIAAPVTTPSSEGGETGPFYEIIAPRSESTCGLSRYVLAEWTVSGPARIIFNTAGTELAVETRINNSPRGTRPFLAGQGAANLIKGHCPEGWCRREAELGHKYAEILLRHGVQPMQNWVAFPPIKNGRLHLDHGAGKGYSFRQLIWSYALSGRIGFPRARRYPDPVTYLKALEATVRAEKLTGRAWVYAADEPQNINALVKELKLYRRHAPSVKVMVTTNRDKRLDGLVDIYAPVFNHLVSSAKPDFEDYAGKELWTYVSCMGSCGPNRAAEPGAAKVPGPDTGLPDMLIDRPAARMFEFFKTAEREKLDAVLYYETVEGYQLAAMGLDLFTDTWNFGGNGDGLLLFPGRPGVFGLKQHAPLASFRLKLIRHAIQTYW